MSFLDETLYSECNFAKSIVGIYGKKGYAKFPDDFIGATSGFDGIQIGRESKRIGKRHLRLFLETIKEDTTYNAIVYDEYGLSDFVVDVFGRKGQITLDTCIARHNILLEEDMEDKKFDKLVEDDTILIGRSSKPIGKKDMHLFFDKLEKRFKDDIFQNDRSYFYEGIRKVDDDLYAIDWGS